MKYLNQIIFTIFILFVSNCSGKTYLVGDVDIEGVCIENSVTIVRAAPEVLILLDRSNSMFYDGFWDPTRQAIVNATREHESRVMFGLALFPSELCNPLDGTWDCTSPSLPDIPIDFFNANRISSFLENSFACGGTPIAQTLLNMENYLLTRPFDNPRTILLATDGAPNCNDTLDGMTCRCTCYDPQACTLCSELPSNCLDDQRTYQALEKLRSDGFLTWVIGLSDAAQVWGDILEKMAESGGTNHFFPAENPDEVEGIFIQLMNMVARCSYHIDRQEVTEQELLNLYVNGEIIPLDPSNQNGWNWQGESLVQFFGEICDSISQNGEANVEATYGCPTVFTAD